jgi:hypothetical protein
MAATVRYDEEYDRYVVSQTFGDYASARETGLWLRVSYRGGEFFTVNLRPEFCYRECRGDFSKPMCPAALTYEKVTLTPNADWSEVDGDGTGCSFADGTNWGSDI